MDALTLIREIQDMGVTLWADGPDLVVRPASRLPADLVEKLRANKPEIMAALREALPRPAEVADDLDACLRLGQRLKRGEINAVLCGITGRRCTRCQGVPCLGSKPWEES